MTKTFCDRCGKEVDYSLRFGSRLIDTRKKYEIGKIASSIGKGPDYTVCESCRRDLSDVLEKYFFDFKREY